VRRTRLSYIPCEGNRSTANALITLGYAAHFAPTFGRAELIFFSAARGPLCSSVSSVVREKQAEARSTRGLVIAGERSRLRFFPKDLGAYHWK